MFDVEHGEDAEQPLVGAPGSQSCAWFCVHAGAHAETFSLATRSTQQTSPPVQSDARAHRSDESCCPPCAAGQTAWHSNREGTPLLL